MSSIKVAVRCRPLFEREKAASGLDIQGRRLLLDAKTYDPDYTFPPSSTQDDVFAACQPILQCVKDGLNGTLMVYGQTGTGKTYTMLGNDGEDNGLVHKVIADMLEHNQQKTVNGEKCALTLSMIEIYNERLTDMLSPNGDEEVSLIGGLPRFTNKVTLCRLDDANKAVRTGLAWRHTAATLMNERSSRSHVVFIIDLEEYNAFTEQTDVAHLFLVDLAGSESLKKSQASGAVASEAGKINKSLLALKGVFLALSNTTEATRPGHVPYRDSKLTELLQDSIGGSARTLMIACISSVGRDIEETKSTLMYAVKARSIRNAANTEREKLLIRLRSVEVENQRLRNRLQERVNERGGYYITKEEHEQAQRMEEELDELREHVAVLLRHQQATDARQHISESLTTTLQHLVLEKEAELQRFKQLHHDALIRFENQAVALQQAVEAGAAEVLRVVRCTTSNRYERLHLWKTGILRRLDAPAAEGDNDPLTQDCSDCLPPVSTAEQPAEDPAAVACVRPALPPVPQPLRAPLATSQPQQQPTLQTAAGGSSKVSLQVPNNRSSARSSLAAASAQRGSCSSSLQASPAVRARRDRRAPDAVASSTSSPVIAPAPVPSTSAAADTNRAPMDPLASSQNNSHNPPGRADVVPSPAAAVVRQLDLAPPTTPPLISFSLKEFEQQCEELTGRLNGAFTKAAEDIAEAYGRHQAALQVMEARRQTQLRSICEALRRDFDRNVNQLVRAEAGATSDLASMHLEFHDTLQLRSHHPPPADALPLQHIVRNACIEAVRSIEDALPPREPHAAVEQAIEQAQRSHRSRWERVVCQSLLPLASMPPPESGAVQPPASAAITSASDDRPPCSPAGSAARRVDSTISRALNVTGPQAGGDGDSQVSSGGQSPLPRAEGSLQVRRSSNTESAALLRKQNGKRTRSHQSASCDSRRPTNARLDRAKR